MLHQRPTNLYKIWHVVYHLEFSAGSLSGTDPIHQRCFQRRLSNTNNYVGLDYNIFGLFSGSPIISFQQVVLQMNLGYMHYQLLVNTKTAKIIILIDCKKNKVGAKR